MELGRFNDIRSRMLSLLYSEAMFNEKGLALIIGGYNKEAQQQENDKLYVISSDYISVRNPTTLVAERTIMLPTKIDHGSPYYYKGKLYFTQVIGDEGRLMSTDLDNKETTNLNTVIVRNIMAMVGSRLFFKRNELDDFLYAYNIEDGTVTSTGIPSWYNPSFEGNNIHVFEDIQEYAGIAAIATYDLTTMPPRKVSKTVFNSIAVRDFFKVQDGKVYSGNLMIYDLRSGRQTGQVDMDLQVIGLNSYKGNFYVVGAEIEDENVTSIEIYNSQWQHLRTLLSGLRDVELSSFYSTEGGNHGKITISITNGDEEKMLVVSLDRAIVDDGSIKADDGSVKQINDSMFSTVG
jgi:hypothetical protein